MVAVHVVNFLRSYFRLQLILRLHVQIAMPNKVRMLKETVELIQRIQEDV